ncbi:MAG: sigma-70 family RNA polymerase sigma factor [Planctomycetaceae bacterium]|nr:sigma-70 family RNA polymerase sigma factor [Planctomycetaceae bacterium]
MDVAAIDSYRKVIQADEGEQLILDHLGYVRHLLGRIVVELPAGVDFENLESAGVLGLVEAAKQFDPSRGIAFTTFAYPRIRGAILDELRRNCPLPQHVLKRWRMIREASTRLGGSVSPVDLAQATGLSEDDVLVCLQAIRLTNPDSWQDEMRTQSRSHYDTRPPSSALEEEEERRLLADAIEQLPTQQRTVVTLYYLEDLRLKEIGEVLGLSESRISRILTAAELRLMETVRSRLAGPTIQLTLRRGISE